MIGVRDMLAGGDGADLFGSDSVLPTDSRKALWLEWYEEVASQFSQADWFFMNFGYAGPRDKSEAAGNRSVDDATPIQFGAQLYEHVAGLVPLRHKTVLEVGCGRGGGALVLARRHKPERLVACDLSARAIAFCRRNYDLPEVRFEVADAEALPFPAASFDAVVSVESSHCYPAVDRFLAGVKRVLRPGGRFVLTDLRDAGEISGLEAQFLRAGLRVDSRVEITEHVTRALRLASAAKSRFIDDRVPENLRPAFREFAALEGSSFFRKFESGEWVYRTYVLSPESGEGTSVPSSASR